DVVAVVMAGGRGTRMRQSGVATPKPLVEVRGLSLLERNLYTLLGAGVRHIHVVVAPPLAEEVRARTQPLASDIEVVVEERPRGTIAAAGIARDTALVVNVDNLTNLDLRNLIEDHRLNGADCTVATHQHGAPIPFAGVTLAGRRIADYVEKPTLRTWVSSG